MIMSENQNNVTVLRPASIANEILVNSKKFIGDKINLKKGKNYIEPVYCNSKGKIYHYSLVYIFEIDVNENNIKIFIDNKKNLCVEGKNFYLNTELTNNKVKSNIKIGAGFVSAVGAIISTAFLIAGMFALLPATILICCFSILSIIFWTKGIYEKNHTRIIPKIPESKNETPKIENERPTTQKDNHFGYLDVQKITNKTDNMPKSEYINQNKGKQ